MTDDILEKVDLRRIAKQTDPQRYEELDREITMVCRNAKEDWMMQQCQEVEERDRQYKVKEVPSRVEQLTALKSKKWNSGCIESKDGRMLFEQNDIADRWAAYMAGLYDDERHPLSQNDALTGNETLKAEVKAAIKTMKKGKATGQDEISAEIFAALDSKNLDTIT